MLEVLKILEVPSLDKPALVTRDSTERPEVVEAGTVILVRADVRGIVEYVNRLLSDMEAYRLKSIALNHYGDGNASARIVRDLAEYVIYR